MSEVSAGVAREAAGTTRAVAPAPAGPDREGAVEALFAVHRLPLVRLAVLLGADDAEDVVAEAFYQLYLRWDRLRSADAAAGYLRSVVVNLTRMRVRHLQVTRQHAERVGPDRRTVLSSEAEAVLRDDQRALVAAVRELPPRQREALVLRYWLDLREREMAEAMGVSAGAVKTHLHRGLAALTERLDGRR